MPQPSGTDIAVALYDEDDYGIDPGAPDAKKVSVVSFGLKSTQPNLVDPTLTGSRVPSEPGKGNIDVAGTIATILAAEDQGILLKHTLGTVTVYRPVSPPAAPNVTGVTFLHANNSTPTGNGTLTFVFTGTTLSWTANGDTAGSAIDVSAGGNFTLQSGTASQEIYVTVTAGSLPGSDQNDADVAVVDARKHVLTVSALPTSFMMERDFGADITGAGRFGKFNGCRVAKMDVDFNQGDYISVNYDVKGADETGAATALDETPTDNGHTSFAEAAISFIKEGGATLGTVKALKFSLSNDLDEDGYVIGNGGVRTQLTEGFSLLTGNLTALFDSTTLLNKALNSTETSLETEVKNGDGFGTSGNERVVFRQSQLKYSRNTPEVAGPKGIIIDLPFDGYGTGFEIDIYNNVATI